MGKPYRDPHERLRADYVSAPPPLARITQAQWAGTVVRIERLERRVGTLTGQVYALAFVQVLWFVALLLAIYLTH